MAVVAVAAAAEIKDILRKLVGGLVKVTSLGVAWLGTRELPRQPRGHMMTFLWLDLDLEEEAKFLAVKTLVDVKE